MLSNRCGRSVDSDGEGRSPGGATNGFTWHLTLSNIVEIHVCADLWKFACLENDLGEGKGFDRVVLKSKINAIFI